jgi:hypothetical protein
MESTGATHDQRKSKVVVVGAGKCEREVAEGDAGKGVRKKVGESGNGDEIEGNKGGRERSGGRTRGSAM